MAERRLSESRQVEENSSFKVFTAKLVFTAGVRKRARESTHVRQRRVISAGEHYERNSIWMAAAAVTANPWEGDKSTKLCCQPSPEERSA